MRSGLFDRFDDDARAVMIVAQEAARSLGRSELGTEHLAIALAQERFSSGALLGRLGVTSTSVIEAAVGAEPPGTVSHRGHLPLDRHAKRAILAGAEEAVRAGGGSVRTEHLLLGIVREGKTPGARLLRGLGVDEAAVRRASSDPG